MCLLAVLSRVHPDASLVVAANRDELLARPAEPMQVLRAEGPRILGGRDVLAGGTWLAVNQHGVCAALTNRPPAGGPLRDATGRSRGELPLLLAQHSTAEAAASAFAAAVSSADYNPCWLLVSDRDAAFYIEVQGSGAPSVSELPPGIHILENSPLAVRTPKTESVRAALASASTWHDDALATGLLEVLRSHAIPETGSPGEARERLRPLATLAACVHAGEYGTRSSAIIIVTPARGDPPQVLHTDGPPCRSSLEVATKLWDEAPETGTPG